ncbi:MAG: S8 family serine peptidase [Proteobacteria bacterium]|nr:S8 family serine peptidase [Pseudomonadota bacterium]
MQIETTVNKVVCPAPRRKMAVPSRTRCPWWLFPILAIGMTLLQPGCYKAEKELLNDELMINGSGAKYLAHEVITKKKKDVDEAAFFSGIADLGGTVVDDQSPMTTRLGYFRIQLPDSLTADQAISRLKSLGLVENAERNYIVEMDIAPNDPYYFEQWNMEMIKAPAAWDITTGSYEIVVAVSDTGVDYQHSDLEGNIWTNPDEIPDNGIDDDNNGLVDDWRGWDWCNNDNEPMDDQYHGTHCAGTIGAIGNNGVAATGVSWKVKIMPLKFLDDDGGGLSWHGAKSILYAADKGARVLNASWGCSACYSTHVEDAIQAFADAGGLFVTAAGNDSKDIDKTPHYPACYTNDNIIAVAATNENDNLSIFSNYGSNKVHIGAPGEWIFNILPRGKGYGYLSGTSMAAPHVVGAAVMYLSQGPDATYEQLKYRLLGTADPISSLAGRVSSNGRLNLLKLLTADDIPPAPPRNLVAHAGSGGDVVLSWSPNTEEDLGMYEIRQGTSSGKYIQRISVSADHTSMRIEDLDNSFRSYFVLYAIDKNGNISPPSKEVNAIVQDITPPAQVIDLTAAPIVGKVASGTTLSVSSENSEHWAGGNATDGNLETAWMSTQSSESGHEYLIVKLNKEFTIDRVHLTPSPAYPEFFPVDFDIDVSLNGSDWTTVGGRRNASVQPYEVVEVLFSPVSATTVRLRVLASHLHDSGYYYSGLAELTAFQVSDALDALELRFTAPGDNPGEGSADYYDIRYSNSLFDRDEFSNLAVIPAPLPMAAGLPESIRVDGLDLETTYYFALVAVDNADNASPMSNIATSTTVVVPPAVITDLEVISTSEGRVTLGWTAKGSNGNVGRATSYDLRYSADPISPADFESALPVMDTPSPAESGLYETHAVTGLDVGRLYYFGIRAVDEGNASGGISNIVSARADDDIDDTPPATVEDLAVFQSTEKDKIGLTVKEVSSNRNGALWQPDNMVDGELDTWWFSSVGAGEEPEWAVFDTGGIEPITQFRIYPPNWGSYVEYFPQDFDIELSVDGINWTTVVHEEGLLAEMGIWYEWSIPATHARYVRMYIHLRGRQACIEDQGCNQNSYITISEFEVYRSTPDFDVDLFWIAPGDDGWSGTASMYDLRHANYPITDDNFLDAQQILIDIPRDSGMLEIVQITPLTWEEDHFFAIKTVDESNNWSAISNVASISSSSVPPAPVSDLTVSGADMNSLSLAWTATGDNGFLGTASAYEMRYMEEAIDNDNWATAISVVDVPIPAESGDPESMTVSGLNSNTTYYFALKVIDDLGISSLISNVAVGETLDNIAPAAITDLIAGAVIQESIRLSDVSVSSPGREYSEETRTENLLDGDANTVWMNPPSQLESDSIELEIEERRPLSRLRLVAAPGYEDLFPVDFVIETRDGLDAPWVTVVNEEDFAVSGEVEEWQLGSVSATHVRLSISKLAMWNGSYYAALGEIELYEDQSDYTAIHLSWTAQGDDGNIGKAVSYNGRISDTWIYNEADFLSADPLIGLPSPRSAGLHERFRVADLAPKTHYCFSIKSSDKHGNVSSLSNSSCANTKGLGPAVVTDLRTDGVTAESVSLVWTAPLDDGIEGKASEYRIKFSTKRINTTNWNNAHEVKQPIAPGPAGTSETFEVQGLEGATTYYFAVMSYGSSGIPSAISNNTKAATWDNIPPSAVMDLEATTNVDIRGGLVVTWTAPGDSGPVGRAAGYDLRVSTEPIDNDSFDEATQISTSSPLQSGSAESAAVSGLEPEILYYVAIKSFDQGNNISSLSNIATAETRDEAPGSISDLAIISGTGDAIDNATIELQWTAPGDDDNIGTAAAYEIRYSESNLNASNFSSGSLVPDPPAPSEAGGIQQVTISGLEVEKRYYFTMKTRDERDNWSDVSNMVSGNSPDDVPPASVVDLVAVTGSHNGSVTLTWTNSGDDGFEGYVSSYDLRYSTAPIVEHNFDNADPANLFGGGQGGLTRTAKIYNLPSEKLLYFALRGVDNAGNISPLSNNAGVLTPEVSPARIVDLSQTGKTLTSIDISWTASGDDEYDGRAEEYDLRYSTEIIDASNFEGAVRVEIGLPLDPLSEEHATIENLAPNTQYYLAIKAIDDRENSSMISNVLLAATSDDEIPGKITTLQAQTSNTSDSILLTWTASGDDGQTGKASLYDLRYSTEAVTASTWASATPVTPITLPSLSGTSQSKTVTGLQGETVFHFAIRSIDDEGNASELSDSVSASTKAVPPAPILDLAGEPMSKSVKLSWTAPGDDGQEGTATEYEIRYSTEIIPYYEFETAMLFNNPPVPEIAGTAQSVIVNGLLEATTYWFAIKTIDDVGAVSTLSNRVSVTTLDETSPAAPGSLSVLNPNQGGVKLDSLWARADSELSDSLDAENVIDGDEHSIWVSAGSEDLHDEILTINLGGSHEIDKIRLLPDDDYLHLFPRNFTISLSDDGQNWSEVVWEEEFEATGANWISWGFAAQSARYVELSSSDQATSFFGLHYTVLAEVEILEAVPPEGQARLTWMAPGDDRNEGVADHYEVYRHEDAFDETSLFSASLIPGAPTPESSGTLQTMTVTGLEGEKVYYWAVRAVDEAGNTGSLSQVVSSTTNEVPPAPISDLEATDIGLTTATLIWTATGNDGFAGTAATHEMRYAPWSLTMENFPLATAVEDLPSILPSGQQQQVTVSGLDSGVLYRFAMTATDEVGATSYLSNVVMVPTEPEPDITPPAATGDLYAEIPSTGGQPIPGTAIDQSSEQPPDFAASQAVDGSLSTIWSSAAKADSGQEWVHIDLGSAVPSDKVRLWPSSDYLSLFPLSFEVRVSVDGLEWFPVYSESDCTAEAGIPFEGDFPSTPVRYVKLVANEPALHDNGYYYVVVAEIEILTASSDPGTVLVTWTAAGDDGDIGQADYYDLRIGACPYEHTSSTPVTTNEPLEAGCEENVWVEDLVSGIYCLGLVTVDEEGNESSLSNNPEVTVPND